MRSSWGVHGTQVALLSILCSTGASLAACKRSPPRHELAAPVSIAKVVPGDYEPIDRLLVGWDQDTELEPFFSELVGHASRYVPVTVLLDDYTTPDHVLEALPPTASSDTVDFLFADSDSVWVRDFGPVMVREGQQLRVIDFDYFGDPRDDVFPTSFAELWGYPVVSSALQFEGGNLLSDGVGNCLTTDILLADNPKQTPDALHYWFRVELGCTNLVILPSLDREDTGHVDMYVAVTGPRRALVGSLHVDVDQQNSERLDFAADTLISYGFDVTRIPMPDPTDGIFRTYTNLLVLNEAVLVPTYQEDDEQRQKALDVLTAAYPTKTIIPVDATEIIRKAGANHCVAAAIARPLVASADTTPPPHP